MQVQICLCFPPTGGLSAGAAVQTTLTDDRTAWERRQPGMGPVPGGSDDELSEMINLQTSRHVKSAHATSLGELGALETREKQRHRELLPPEMMLPP